MRITNDRLAVQNRANRYLIDKMIQRQKKERHDMDMFMAFITGLAVAMIVGFGYEMYIIGGF